MATFPVPSAASLKCMPATTAITGSSENTLKPRWPLSCPNLSVDSMTREDGFWTACSDNRVQGSIIIDGIKADSEGAHLRWYIVSEKLHGQGIGRQLISIAMDFCRKRHYKQVFLWTFAGLDPARHLYEKSGFKLVHEQQGSQWGTTVTEQKYVCEL